MPQLEITSDWVEFAAVVASLVLSVAVSFRYYRENSGRPKIALGLVLMSLIASSNSGVALLGKPAESYAHGIQFAFCFTAIQVFDYVSVRYVFLPVVVKLKTVSIYEYFDLRFDSRVRKLASVPYIVMRTLGISLSVIPPVIIIHQFSGLGETTISVALTLLTAFYTTIGGFKGVVWTDALQAAVMFTTMAVLTTLSVVKVGGFGRMFQIAYDTKRLSVPPLLLDPTERISIWSYGLFLSGLSSSVFNQSVYQRFKSLSTEKEIKNALSGLFLGTAAFTLAASFVGLSIYAYYNGCDPKESQLVDSYSNVIVYWINDVGQNIRGLRGLYIAGITCASISTMSTHLNTVSQLICSGLSKGNPPQYLVRLVTFGIGLLATVIDLIIKNTSNLIELSFTFNCLEGVTSGLFILGTLFISANTKGALAGGLTTIALSIIMVIGTRLTNGGSYDSFTVEIMRTDLCSHEFNSTSFGSESNDERASDVFFLFKLSPFSMGTMATLLTVTTGVVVSLLFPAGSRSMTKSDADLFCPCVHRFLKRENARKIDEDSSNNLVETSH